MDVEDSAASFVVGQRELDLSVDPTGTDQGRVEAVDPVGRHDDFDVAARVESVELKRTKDSRIAKRGNCGPAISERGLIRKVN